MSFTSELHSPFELRQTIRQLARLVEISVTLNSTLEIETLLQYIAESAADLLNCDAAAILLYNHAENHLVFTASTGIDPQELSRQPVALEGTIAGSIFLNNEPLVINDVDQDERRWQLTSERTFFNPHKYLGVPMRLRDNVIGVLEALNKRSEDFSSSDIRLLGVTASHAAVAIENARLVTALQQANEELLQANKLKSDFLAIASHELRTPLGIILGYASLLKDEVAGPPATDHAEIVLSSALRLHSLVEEMTTMNQLQVGRSGLHTQAVPIQKILANVVQNLSNVAEKKQQKINLQIPNAPLVIQGDQPKLEIVFSNLLNNAIRFTPDGGQISIKVSAAPGKIGVEVVDNGSGIEPDHLEKIFQPFYQVENHLTRRVGGMGLGLATARGIVELHGGRIWAESEGAGKGSTLKVVLPRAA